MKIVYSPRDILVQKNSFRIDWKGLVLASFVILILLVSAELCSYLIIKFYKNTSTTYIQEPGDLGIGTYKSIADPVLGWRMSRDDNYQSILKKADGNVLYDVNYRTDSFGRRQVNVVNENAQKHLIIWGDSLSFGTGLSKEQTLQSGLAKSFPNYQVYNYSVHGYGPHQILMQIRQDKLEQQISQDNGIAVYFFNPDYILRALGSSQTSWNFSSPAITVTDDGKLQYHGSIEAMYPIRSLWFKFYAKLKLNSYLLSLVGLDFPIKFNDSDIKLIAQLIIESAKEYHAKFNGSFIVVFHPLYNNMKSETAMIRTYLESNNIPTLSYDMPILDEYYIPREGHPSAKFNKIFIPMLMESLKKEGV